MVYYGYRCYMPQLQRWLNRDPLADPANHLGVSASKPVVRTEVVEAQEFDGPNLFRFVNNSPNEFIDAFGLCGRILVSSNCKKKKCAAAGFGMLPEEGWEAKRNNGENPWEDVLIEPGALQCADALGVPGLGALKIPDNCVATIECDASGSPTRYTCTCFAGPPCQWNPRGIPSFPWRR